MNRVAYVLTTVNGVYVVRHTHGGKMTKERRRGEVLVRLRRRLLSVIPVGYAVTLTLRKEMTQAEWERMMRRMAEWCRRRRVGCLWRVEEQERGVRHLHCLLQYPVAAELKAAGGRHDVLEGFLGQWRSLGGGYTQARVMDSVGWVRYLAPHIGKRCQWSRKSFKHWGMWARRYVKEDKGKVERLTSDEAVGWMRFLKRMTKTKGDVGSILVFGSGYRWKKGAAACVRDRERVLRRAES